MIVVQWIHDYCAENTFAMDSHVVWWPVIVSSSMPSRNLRWGKKHHHNCSPGWTWFPAPVPQWRKCHKKDIVPPSAHIPLLSRMTGVKFTASAFILAMKYQVVIYDPILWLSGFVLLSGCVHKLHQFLLPLCVSTCNSTPKQACHLI